MIAICLCLVVVFIQQLDSQRYLGGYPPEELYYPTQLESYMAVVIMNLTTWICKDATMKLWHAERIRKKYKGAVSYELGSITSGIQDVFKNMLQVYKKYSNMTDFRFNKYGMEEIMNAYHIMKGDFNAIRMEKSRYARVVAQHKQKLRDAKSPRMKKINDLLKKPKAKSRRGAQPNHDELVFKKNLRYEKWAAKWKNFIPEVEGIDIENVDLDFK